MTGRGFAAVVLAGGFSSRMKAFKPLLSLGTSTVAGRVLSTFRECSIRTILVAGHRREELFRGIDTSGVILQENPDYEQGMFSSVQKGLAHIAAEDRAFFVLPVDVPLVRPTTIRRLTEAFTANPADIMYPTFRGKRGHPPLIAASLVPAILAWKGDDGLKGALATVGRTVSELAVADGNILFDIDTPEDYKELLQRYETREIPTADECRALFELRGTPPSTIAHGEKVAEVAVTIGELVQQAGTPVDLALLRTAGILHDIAKGASRHDEAGGHYLREHGFALVGDTIGVHTDLTDEPAAVPLAAKIVYFADKLVQGDRVVGIEERYRSSHHKFGDDPEVAARVQRRKERALGIGREIEELAGLRLNEIMNRPATVPRGRTTRQENQHEPQTRNLPRHPG